MKREEIKLSKYIDQLNAEKMPQEHRRPSETEEFDKLTETVKKVRALRDPAMPGEEFTERLFASLGGETMKHTKKSGSKFIKRTAITLTAAAAAAVVVLTVPNITLPGGETNIVYAMEQALSEIKAYHGVLEVIETNELGETMIQARKEVWADKDGYYYIKDMEGNFAGLITVNNGEKEWQIRPEEEKVYIYSAFPDPYRFTFELGSELEDVKKAHSIKEIGEETLLGRKTTILEITPEGGEPYHLWIDNETDLPLQKQTSMQNAIQYKVKYSEIEYLDNIPTDLLAYELPLGYEEVNKNQEQVVTTLDEARSIVGFTPKLSKDFKEEYALKKITVLTDIKAVRVYYGTSDPRKAVVVQQQQAKDKFQPSSAANLGSVNQIPAEILYNYEGVTGTNSIRWQEEGMEYTLYGTDSIEVVADFATGITDGDVLIPTEKENEEKKPEIEVPFDLEVEESDQKNADAGHSPWKLDPVFVTQVFASLLLSPEGITGDYPIAYEDIHILENNGIQAVAEITSENTVAKYVYLERLIRQDETGIWTVVGYDPAN